MFYTVYVRGEGLETRGARKQEGGVITKKYASKGSSIKYSPFFITIFS